MKKFKNLIVIIGFIFVLNPIYTQELELDSDIKRIGQKASNNPSATNIQSSTVQSQFNAGAGGAGPTGNSLGQTGILRLSQNCSGLNQAFDNTSGTIHNKVGTSIPYLRYIFNNGSCSNSNVTGSYTGV